MRYRIVAALIVLIAIGVVIGTASSEGAPMKEVTPLSCDGKPVDFHVERAHKLIDKGYAHSRYPDRSPISGEEKHALKDQKLCVLDDTRRAGIAEYRDHKASAYEKYRKRRAFREKYTPYYFGEPTLRYVAIPPDIVRCETNGYYGADRWRAANPSGAVGPYQLLGHGAPYPADTAKERRQNHKIAAELYAGGAGRSQWEC